MRNAELAVVLSLISAFSGCSIVPHRYAEPTGGSVAEIEFLPDSNYRNSVQTYENARDCSKRSLVKKVLDDNDVTRRVTADKEIAFTFSHVVPGFFNGCNVTFSFVPKSNEKYIAKSSVASNQKACSATLFKVNADGSTSHVDVTYRADSSGMPMDENSSYCAAQ
jgi:hypothetical protein